jgi:hypothetical protein
LAHQPTKLQFYIPHSSAEKKEKKKKVWRYNETSKATRGMQVYDLKFIFGEKKKKKNCLDH